MEIRATVVAFPKERLRTTAFRFRPEANFIARAVRATALGRGPRSPHAVWSVWRFWGPVFSRPPISCLIVWLNAYICRQVFFIEFTGKMNSIHGVWIAMANLAGEHWYKPAWWPHWYNGMPFEYTYAPLVPALSAAIAWLF